MIAEGIRRNQFIGAMARCHNRDEKVGMVTFSQVDKLPALKLPGGVMYRLMGEKLTVMWGKRAKGSQTAKHSHPHEQIAWLMSGKLECRIGDGPLQTLEAGTTFLIPGGIEHEFWYAEDCEIVEIFSPPRHDLFPDDGEF